MTAPTVKVLPIYGWGWSVGKDSFPVPASFTMRIEESSADHWSGPVIDPGHEFFGRWASASQRRVQRDGEVNISIAATAGSAHDVSGFAILSERPSASGLSR